MTTEVTTHEHGKKESRMKLTCLHGATGSKRTETGFFKKYLVMQAWMTGWIVLFGRVVSISCALYIVVTVKSCTMVP